MGLAVEYNSTSWLFAECQILYESIVSQKATKFLTFYY